MTTVQVDTPPVTADEAYDVALRWARRWGIPDEAIKEWNARRRSGAAEVIVSLRFLWS